MLDDRARAGARARRRVPGRPPARDARTPARRVGVYASVMRTQPALRPYALLRVADMQSELGHPELSSGLLVSLLQNDPPPSLLQNGERLLIRALEQGGDCRVLEDLALEKLPASTRRRLVLYRLDCAPAQRSPSAPPRCWRCCARTAPISPRASPRGAAAAARSSSSTPTRRESWARASIITASSSRRRKHLAIAVQDLPRDLDRRAHLDTLYLLLRSRFWTGELEHAATGFGDLAERTRRPDDRSSRALSAGPLLTSCRASGDRRARAIGAPTSPSPPASSPPPGWSSAMRVEWRDRTRRPGARDPRAAADQRRVAQRDGARRALPRASDLVRRRGDRAGHWLAPGRARRRAHFGRDLVLAGRLEEIAGSAGAAVDHYLEAIGLDPYHPLAVAARDRLLSTELRSLARGAGDGAGRLASAARLGRGVADAGRSSAQRRAGALEARRARRRASTAARDRGVGTGAAVGVAAVGGRPGGAGRDPARARPVERRRLAPRSSCFRPAAPRSP